jgi:hypothetical protein
LFSKATLDIIGLITLGKELDSFTAKPSFHECYDLIFNQSSLSAIITAINTYIPLRSWLPLAANRSFVAANDEVKRILRQQIRLRQKEMATVKTAAKMSSRTCSKRHPRASSHGPKMSSSAMYVSLLSTGSFH